MSSLGFHSQAPLCDFSTHSICTQAVFPSAASATGTNAVDFARTAYKSSCQPSSDASYVTVDPAQATETHRSQKVSRKACVWIPGQIDSLVDLGHANTREQILKAVAIAMIQEPEGWKFRWEDIVCVRLVDEADQPWWQSIFASDEYADRPFSKHRQNKRHERADDPSCATTAKYYPYDFSDPFYYRLNVGASVVYFIFGAVLTYLFAENMVRGRTLLRRRELERRQEDLAIIQWSRAPEHNGFQVEEGSESNGESAESE